MPLAQWSKICASSLLFPYPTQFWLSSLQPLESTVSQVPSSGATNWHSPCDPHASSAHPDRIGQGPFFVAFEASQDGDVTDYSGGDALTVPLQIQSIGPCADPKPDGLVQSWEQLVQWQVGFCSSSPGLAPTAWNDNNGGASWRIRMRVFGLLILVGLESRKTTRAVVG